MEEFKCLYCTMPTHSIFHQLCNDCFKPGEPDPIRQTGRTVAALKRFVVTENALYVMPTEQMLSHMKRAYPAFAPRFVSLAGLELKLESTKCANVFFDHTVYEFYPRHYYSTDRILKKVAAKEMTAN